MPPKKDILEELQFLSDRISTQVRTLALGVLALTWGLLIGESDVAKDIASQMKSQLLMIGGLSVLVMFADFLQYVFGYINTNDVLKRVEKSNLQEAKFDTSSFSYRLRKWFFLLKQWLTVVLVLWLLLVLIRWFWR